MAEAKKTTVDKKVTKTEAVPMVTLTLSIDEAEAVGIALGNITGDNTNSPRKHTDAVYWALTAVAGVNTLGSKGRQIEGTQRWLNAPKKPLYSY